MKCAGRLLVLGAVVVAAVHVAPAAAQPGPLPVGIVLALEPLPGATSGAALDINDTNVIVGWSYTAGASHAVRWPTFSRPIELVGLPGNAGAVATSINNSGVVVGHSFINSVAVPTKWTADGTVSELAEPTDYTSCTPTSINDGGVIAGRCDKENQTSAVRWAPDGTVTVLETPSDARVTQAQDINNTGTVVGGAILPAGSRAVRWGTDGRLATLPLPSGADEAEATAMNDGNQITGNSTKGAVRWEPSGAVQYLAPLPGVTGLTTFAADINDQGFTVGEAYSAEQRWVATWWAPNRTVNRLPSLPASGPDAYDTATAINNKGAVVGSSGGDAVLWARRS